MRAKTAVGFLMPHWIDSTRIMAIIVEFIPRFGIEIETNSDIMKVKRTAKILVYTGYLEMFRGGI